MAWTRVILYMHSLIARCYIGLEGVNGLREVTGASSGATGSTQTSSISISPPALMKPLLSGYTVRAHAIEVRVRRHGRDLEACTGSGAMGYGFILATPLLAVGLEYECWCVWEKVDAFEDGACDALEMSPSSKAASSSMSEMLSRPRMLSSSTPGHVGGSSWMAKIVRGRCMSVAIFEMGRWDREGKRKGGEEGEGKGKGEEEEGDMREGEYGDVRKENEQLRRRARGRKVRLLRGRQRVRVCRWALGVRSYGWRQRGSEDLVLGHRPMPALAAVRSRDSSTTRARAHTQASVPELGAHRPAARAASGEGPGRMSLVRWMAGTGGHLASGRRELRMRHKGWWSRMRV
ncbi:hypothetical protein FB451DRAFT_1379293 [Mycena latifolia]|nr:hypothetical protein FB451DRAFT_1379293 [Mycena latifolia]